MGKLTTSKRNMLISRFYTDACLDKRDATFNFIVRHAMLNPRYVIDTVTIQEHYRVYDNKGRRIVPAIYDYMIVDRTNDKWKIYYPHQFFPTQKQQWKVHYKALSMVVNMQHRAAFKRDRAAS